MDNVGRLVDVAMFVTFTHANAGAVVVVAAVFVSVVSY